MNEPRPDPLACEHRGEHMHECSSVWLPEIKRLALKVKVTCQLCKKPLKFDPNAPICRIRITPDELEMRVLLK